MQRSTSTFLQQYPGSTYVSDPASARLQRPPASNKVALRPDWSAIRRVQPGCHSGYAINHSVVAQGFYIMSGVFEPLATTLVDSTFLAQRIPFAGAAVCL